MLTTGKHGQLQPFSREQGTESKDTIRSGKKMVSFTLLDIVLSAGRIENVCSSIHEETDKLRQAIRSAHFEEMSKASRTISDRIHQLSGHCNINLVNDALRYFQNALKEPGSNEVNAVSA